MGSLAVASGGRLWLPGSAAACAGAIEGVRRRTAGPSGISTSIRRRTTLERPFLSAVGGGVEPGAEAAAGLVALQPPVGPGAQHGMWTGTAWVLRAYG